MNWETKSADEPTGIKKCKPTRGKRGAQEYKKVGNFCLSGITI